MISILQCICLAEIWGRLCGNLPSPAMLLHSSLDAIISSCINTPLWFPWLVVHFSFAYLYSSTLCPLSCSNVRSIASISAISQPHQFWHTLWRPRQCSGGRAAMSAPLQRRNRSDRVERGLPCCAWWRIDIYRMVSDLCFNQFYWHYYYRLSCQHVSKIFKTFLPTFGKISWSRHAVEYTMVSWPPINRLEFKNFWISLSFCQRTMIMLPKYGMNLRASCPWLLLQPHSAGPLLKAFFCQLLHGPLKHFRCVVHCGISMVTS